MLALPAHESTPCHEPNLPQWLPLLPLPVPPYSCFPNTTISQSMVTPPTKMNAPSEPGVDLLYVLSIHIMLNSVVPHLAVGDVLRLAATSRRMRAVILSSPTVFRHLDLSSASFANLQPIDGTDGSHGMVMSHLLNRIDREDNFSEERINSAPIDALLSVIHQRGILSSVKTLVLDGVSVSAGTIGEILMATRYSVRILSIRNIQNTNIASLQQILQLYGRTARDKGSSRIKGIYIFGKGDKDQPKEFQPFAYKPKPIANDASRDLWWDRQGKIFEEAISPMWAQTILACEGLVAFDAVMCKSPNHHNSKFFRKDAHGSNFRPPPWAVATVSVLGCSGCKGAPEGMTYYEPGKELSLPLLDPLPVFSSTLRAATKPRDTGLCFVPRCQDCLHRRYCVSCNKWWCENCYSGPSDKPDITPQVSRKCWECGMNCHDCMAKTQAKCAQCNRDYCTLHGHNNNDPSRCHLCIAARKTNIPGPVLAFPPRMLARRGANI